ncbi:MAG: peptide chain release factor H [Rhodanobacteraceae bacterium]|nr:peptide chain release factor H [Rhodanobacteraceae bacterium]
MVLLQLSASRGPAECALAVAKCLVQLQREALASNVSVEVIDTEAGPEPGTWRSLLLTLDGAEAAAFAQRWNGTLLWVCASPYRPAHKRKNWFFGGRVFELPQACDSSEVRFEAIRASGPGGQHVNKTASAVRATHLASGISVKAQTERSQQANKRLALALIEQRLAERAEAAAADQRADRHRAHRTIDRGNALRTFRDRAFTPDAD